VIRTGERVFVDTGAWIALAVVCDSLHPRARGIWIMLSEAGARLVVSFPVVLETYTYLQRKVSQDLAERWLQSLDSVRFLERVECTHADLKTAIKYLSRPDFHKLSMVDATSFVLMKKHKLRVAFAFDTHFATAGFRLV
jgi:predicted nucleic acid-binding protein